MGSGTLIVIDGTDGSGKATQTEQLVTRLQKEGHKVEKADFPQYSKPSAYFVEKYLRGEYGGVNEVSAEQASILYAVDRFDASFNIRKKLEEGTIIISNRYVTSNMGHQAGKIHDKKKRDEFLKWLEELEYRILNIPKPDVSILLYMPPEIGQQLVDKKESREYTQGKKRDIHEEDIEHLQNAATAYLYCAKKYGWKVIECAPNERLRTVEDIHEELWGAVKRIL